MRTHRGEGRWGRDFMESWFRVRRYKANLWIFFSATHRVELLDPRPWSYEQQACSNLEVLLTTSPPLLRYCFPWHSQIKFQENEMLVCKTEWSRPPCHRLFRFLTQMLSDQIRWWRRQELGLWDMWKYDLKVELFVLTNQILNLIRSVHPIQVAC